MRSQRWWHQQGVKLGEVKIARKRLSFLQKVKKGQISTDLTSFTVHHTGNQDHTHTQPDVNQVIWQKILTYLNRSDSWAKTAFGWITDSRILNLQNPAFLAMHLTSSCCTNFVQNCHAAFLLKLCCRIARQWTLRSDVWQEMSDFSSLVQDRFLTVSVAGTHFRLN